jgi:hypothetical protein
MQSSPKARRLRIPAQQRHDTLVAALAKRVERHQPRSGLQFRPSGPGTMTEQFAAQCLGEAD